MNKQQALEELRKEEMIKTIRQKCYKNIATGKSLESVLNSVLLRDTYKTKIYFRQDEQGNCFFGQYFDYHYEKFICGWSKHEESDISEQSLKHIETIYSIAKRARDWEKPEEIKEYMQETPKTVEYYDVKCANCGATEKREDDGYEHTLSEYGDDYVCTGCCENGHCSRCSCEWNFIERPH